MNVVLSIILVQTMGLVGIAIGTLIATLIRAIELIWYANKHILKRTFLKMLAKFVITIISVSSSAAIVYFISNHAGDNYLSWFIAAVAAVAISSIITFLLNLVVFGKDLKYILSHLRKLLPDIPTHKN